MTGEVLVRVENVSKRFCRSLKRSLWYGLKDLGSEIGGRRHGGGRGLPQSSADVQLRPDEFWAVEDVSFELRRGECLGLIGSNGAGKTTLLRMLNGLIKPDAGCIQMHGQVGAMIALGAGFNPVLTGRENIRISASLAGYNAREIDEKIDEIIDFAEIRDFIDTPVRSYSSGMQVRLGFAAASSLSPDILILDEVLAVGDVGFKTKCYNRIYNLASQSAVIFVSHAMGQIQRLCSKSIVMASGRVSFAGQTSEAIERYNQLFKREVREWISTGSLEVQEIVINGSKDRSIIYNPGEDLIIQFSAISNIAIANAEISINIIDNAGELIYQASNLFSINFRRIEKGQINIKLTAKNPLISSGKKYMSLYIANVDTKEIVFWAKEGWEIEIKNSRFVPFPGYSSLMIE